MDNEEHCILLYYIPTVIECYSGFQVHLKFPWFVVHCYTAVTKPVELYLAWLAMELKIFMQILLVDSTNAKLYGKQFKLRESLKSGNVFKYQRILNFCGLKNHIKHN